ncbi:MAG TPA: LpqB family beta-propeller domain-containing protein [Pyrinomonadaceae bacterium]
MDAELWKQVDELLDAALELPPAEREGYVASACGGNEELRREVLSLLRAQEQAGTFLAGSAMRAAAQALARESDGRIRGTLVSKEIGNYRVEKLLGAGGMGEVYLAFDARLNRKVALKILPPEFVADAERVARFEREARAVSALNHPNLVTIYDLGRLDGLHYIAMEYVEGRTLREVAGSRIKLKELLSVVTQAAEALAAAHAAGVVHRDVKPENIMLRADGYVKVLDFGLAKLLEPTSDGGAAETQAGAVMGTLAYMSPEQAAAEPLDPRTDVWSLGVVLYELATGRKPFVGNNRRETVNAILSEEPAPATETDPALPPELDHILSKALEKDRELRYQTVSDLRADLKRLWREIESAPSQGVSGRGSSRVGHAAGRARAYAKPLLVVASLLLVVAAVFVGWRLLKSREEGPDWSRASHLRLTDQAGTEFHPSLAPDGRTFVYSSDQSGNFDILLQRVGGMNPTNLTKDSAADDKQPAFSPDGERIAFRSGREPAGIYVMGATGENVRLVSEGGFHPSWSPDGKEIVYSAAGRDEPDVRNTTPSKLWVVNVESGAKRLLSDLDAMQPAWSPHGARVAFWFMPPAVGRSDVATVPSGGGEPVVVTRDALTNWNPVWSPDGKFLYFASDKRGSMSFWRVRIEEETGRVLSEPEAVVTPSTYSRHLGFSRDGRRMVYVQTNNRANIQAADFDARTEKLTGEPRWVTRGDRFIVRPELSPDGRRFVMRLPRRTQDDIVLVNRDGTAWRDLTDDKFFDRYPRWSPDGKRIAFVSDRGGSYEIWTIDAEGTNLRQLTFNSSPNASFPVWSHDGARLLFRKETFSYIIDLGKSWEAQTPEQVPQPPTPGDYFGVWDWSPDGTKLAGTFAGTNGPGFGYYSFETRRFEKVTDFYALPYWLPDSRRIVFAYDGKAHVIDTVTKKMREIFALPLEKIRSVGVSRDGLLLYYTLLSTESDVWLLNLE